MVGLCLALLGTATACSVTVTEPYDANPDRACRNLLASLPTTLSEQDRRSVDPPNAPAVAWGRPPVVVRCLAQMPAGFDDESSCELIDEVGWYVPQRQSEDPALDATATTIGTEPIVSVDIPAERRGDAAAILTELARAVREELTTVKPCV
ncbi:MAG: DUF3515 family protein [Nocardioides sp.]